jgi:hypothetical protein
VFATLAAFKERNIKQWKYYLHSNLVKYNPQGQVHNPMRGKTRKASSTGNFILHHMSATLCNV